MQNILMRFGIERNLNFVLPFQGNYLGYSGSGSKFHHSFIYKLFRQKFNKFNILCHHTRFDYRAIVETMEKSTVFVTILRDPATLFESWYNYAYFKHALGTTLLQMLKSPDIIQRIRNQRLHNFKGFNQSLFDLGYEAKDFDQDELRSAIETLDSQFDLVMVMERFDESLILLRSLMNWTMQDLVYFKKNARGEVQKLDQDVVRQLRDLNSGDVKLYEYFCDRFDEKVKEFGMDRMQSELSSLRELNKEWMDLCVSEAKPNKLIQDVERRGYFPNAVGYELKTDIPMENRSICNYLTLAELKLTDFVRNGQLKRL